MNKKEIAEIKKQFGLNTKTSFGKLLTAYIDHEKTTKFVQTKSLLNLPEIEILMYLDIFKKTLGGSIGKNLLEFSFPIVDNRDSEEKTMLMSINSSELKDEEKNAEYIQKIVNGFNYAGDYYIVALSCSYAIPNKNNSETDGEDSSEAYDFVLTSICPVNKVERGLCFSSEDNAVSKNYDTHMEVGKPMHGFLFPVFNDRTKDVNSIMYFTGKPKEPSQSIIEDVLGCEIKLSADIQKEKFNNMLARVLSDDSTYNVTSTIHAKLNEIIENNATETEPVELNADEIKKILQNSGVDEENMEEFDDIYEEEVGDGVSLAAVNITDESAMKIGSPDIKISVKPSAASKVEAKMVDGKRCLVIAVDETVQVNGLDVVCK